MRAEGEVVLVGAGCGRGLLTLCGLEEIQNAEVLVYDDLIDRELLWAAPDACERIYVGKRSGKHSLKQEEINALLLREARAGRRVVRLKGGDSYVFGRGGEEMQFLLKRGIRCRTVPGVTSAIAVPEEMGIPVTQRGLAQSFTVITGHTAIGEGENYEALAGLRGTLVFLMGIQKLRNITEELLRCGKAPDTPCAVLTQGFTADAQRINGTLENIAALAAEAVTPGILVVGENAALNLKSRKRNPLSGVSVIVTGTALFAERVTALLKKYGADAESSVSMRTEPITGSIPCDFSETGWLVFTSRNGVELFFREMKRRGTDIRSFCKNRFACIGRGTAEQLEKYLLRADLIPEQFTAEALGRELGKRMRPGEKAILLRAENGSAALTEELRKAGADFRDISIYRTIPCGNAQPLRQSKAPQYMVFGSAGSVRFWLSKETLDVYTVPVGIGPYTAEELRKQGRSDCLVADSCTPDGIVRAILEDYRRKAGEGI